jgi:hypothetical protein
MSRRRVVATREAQLAQLVRDQRFRALNADDCAPTIPPWAPKWLRSRLRVARDDAGFQAWLSRVEA